MVLEALVWSWRRFRPAEGWLPVFLLTAATIVLLAQIAAINWVPEVQIVWIALFALFRNSILKKNN